MTLQYSGLPMDLDPETGELTCRDGLLYDGSSQKTAGQMEGLFRSYDPCAADQLVYRAYRNIRFPEDEPLFQKKGLRYDLTVILPGSVNGEYYKTSGHYHGVPELKRVPYPEVYEVVQGEIVFVLQRNEHFSREDGGQITQLQAVRVKAGQAVIVPPHCGHGSVNPLDSISAFSNIAVTECPIEYGPVRSHHGLAAYILKDPEGRKPFLAVPNEHYGNLPDIELAQPVENPALGIQFGIPCYQYFITHPDRFNYLLQPDNYMEIIDAMTRSV